MKTSEQDEFISVFDDLIERITESTLEQAMIDDDLTGDAYDATRRNVVSWMLNKVPGYVLEMALDKNIDDFFDDGKYPWE